MDYLEIIATIIGFVYIYLEIKELKLMWIAGVVLSVLYFVVFFNAKFYADMSLQLYYLFVSIYGWIEWSKKTGNSSEESKPIVKTPRKQIFALFLVTAVIFLAYAFVLKIYTDSPLPYWDSFTTSLSITATWMLAKKYIEQWWLWVLVDLTSAILYIYKNLYPTALLFAVYTALAIIGYFQWRKNMKNYLVDIKE